MDSELSFSFCFGIVLSHVRNILEDSLSLCTMFLIGYINKTMPT
jgi:hypothetical protein